MNYTVNSLLSPSFCFKSENLKSCFDPLSFMIMKSSYQLILIIASTFSSIYLNSSPSFKYSMMRWLFPIVLTPLNSMAHAYLLVVDAMYELMRTFWIGWYLFYNVVGSRIYV
jgi:hypothetical protein